MKWLLVVQDTNDTSEVIRWSQGWQRSSFCSWLWEMVWVKEKATMTIVPEDREPKCPDCGLEGITLHTECGDGYCGGCCNCLRRQRDWQPFQQRRRRDG